LIAPEQNRSLSSMLAVIFLGFSAVYCIPYFVPEQDGLSFSYLVGFNNRAAILLLILFILGFALWTRGLGLRLPASTSQSKDTFWRMGAIAVACSVISCALIWLLARPLGPLMESQYFLDRYAMYDMGGRLFRDFEFDYGPLMFYPSIWFARLCHVSLGNGYFLTWTLQWALGTWLLWKIVEVAARGTSSGRTIFMLFWAFFMTGIPDSGTNYTPLRFCAALALALAVHALAQRGASLFAVFGLASIGATALLLYSPEQGLVFIIGTILFFILCVRPARPDLFVGLASFALVMGLALWTARRIGLLDNVAAVGGGGLNFPLLFSLQSLVLLLLLLVAGCVFIAGARTQASHSPLLYLICLSCVSAPAAFSRADNGHIILNSLGALIVALVVLSQYRTIWRWVWPTFAIILLLATYGKLTLYQGVLRTQVHDAVFVEQYHSPVVDKIYTTIYKLTHRNAQFKLDQLRASLYQNTDRYSVPLPAHAVLLAPFGVQRRLTPLPDGIRIVTGRYPWLFPIGFPAVIPQKIAEIETHPDLPLLLHSSDNPVCEYDHSEERLGLQKFFLAPYMPPLRQTIHIGQQLCDYINANYVVSSYASPVPHLFVWVRKGNTFASPTEK